MVLSADDAGPGSSFAELRSAIGSIAMGAALSMFNKN